MGAVVVHEFLSLDGVFEDPRWTFDFGFDPEMGETLGDITGAAGAILLGRRTFEMFAPAWSTRTAEDDPGAPFFNDTLKHVVCSREPDVQWGPSSRLAYRRDAIQRLKDGTDGSIYVSGSGTLVRAMLQDGLVDELHLFVYPVALGTGERLFHDGDGPTTLDLLGIESYQNGVVHLAYGLPDRPHRVTAGRGG